MARARRSASRCARAARPVAGRLDPRTDSTALAASPSSRPNPNFESSWPVWMYEWVSGLIPGVTRISTSWLRPASAQIASRRSISSKRVADHVADVRVDRVAQLGGGSCCCRACGSGRVRSRRAMAVCSSPPEATSTDSPCSAEDPQDRGDRRRLARVTGPRSRRCEPKTRRDRRERGSADRPRSRCMPACRTARHGRRRHSRRSRGGRAR